MSVYERNGAKKQSDNTYLGSDCRYEVKVLGAGEGFKYRQSGSTKPWTELKPGDAPLKLRVGHLQPA